MLIKKRYLMILSVAIVSVLIGSLFYINITLAPKEQEPTRVDVINLPIDEQGNLKTTIVETSEIVLVFNETLTVSSSVSTYTYLTSFNTSGFKYGFIMAKATGSFDVNAVIRIHLYENNFGVLTLPAGIGSIILDAGSETYKPNWGTGTSPRYELHSVSTDLYLYVNNSGVGFDGLLTIVVQLSN